MKTVRELKELLKANDGKLTIGELEITWRGEGEDIDVHFFDEIAQWYRKDVSDDAPLNDASIYSISETVKNRGVALQEAKANAEKLEKQIAALEKRIADASLAEGKIEAYEKILIGREITVSR